MEARGTSVENADALAYSGLFQESWLMDRLTLAYVVVGLIFGRL